MIGLKYGIVGFRGKMGREIFEYFSTFGDECVLKKDVDSFEQTDTPQVIIDFSSPSALEETVKLCREHKIALVLGTTALEERHFEMLRELANEVPVVQSYNFSTGINILRKILREYTRYFSDWDAAMVEIHHTQKKDAPSGTAKMLRNDMNRDIPISSLRIGGVFGEHTVIFSNAGEVVEIKHSALSRRAFSIGVRHAALFTLKKQKGFYSYEDVLNENLR
ncbi:MAG: dihydrodipicolinate reductase C-terminal domain-containing protein [Fervidobacterium sp.]|uniref:4-hydroxy-tetrahydrodipicolinate reductase n=1 Tax=Fervidobacterium gondwanense DSM 13020 TaxID=1121883 RepID=A0A1M7SDJ5_FERGO|nr:dihydrodipicolinate reductase C-terminal domain-containing protein [Fervidobacterium gondwanense]UXF01207.1 dihydrodipicolinate reductase [Fervidobacterium riparium]SHN56539.1 dihydrodipicolinate reductase [Fervidobacterium gondwanense DSM 13020]